MRRVLRLDGTLMIAEAHVPRAFGGNCLRASTAMIACHARLLSSSGKVAEVNFEQVQTGVMPRWLLYGRAIKPADAMRQ